MTSSSPKKEKKKEKKYPNPCSNNSGKKTRKKIGKVLNKNVFSLLFPVQSIYRSSVCERILSLLIMEEYDLIILVSDERK